MKMAQRMWKSHQEDVVAYDLLLKHQVANVHQVPALSAVTVRLESGRTESKKAFIARLALEVLTGQRALRTEGTKQSSWGKGPGLTLAGALVTLRGKLAEDLLLRVSQQILPASKAVSVTFCRQAGAFTLKVPQTLLFPEMGVHFEKFQHLGMLELTLHLRRPQLKSASAVCTLLRGLGFPVGVAAKRKAKKYKEG